MSRTVRHHHIREGMVISFDDLPFYVLECDQLNDGSTRVRGNYWSFREYPSATVFFYDQDRVKIIEYSPDYLQ